MKRSLRSYIHHFIRFPLLRRPILVSIPLWVTWWTCAHHKAPTFFGCCSVQELRGHWLSNLVFPGLSDAIEAITSGFLSRCIARPNSSSASIFLWLFTCIFLRSFRHHFKTIDGTGMANKLNKWIHSSRVKFPLVKNVCKLVFGVNVLNLDLLGPNWFDRTTNQKKLCQRCTTKLPYVKNWRLREQNQHCLDHVHGSHRSWLLWYVFPWKLRRSNPINQVRVYHPNSVLCPEKWFLILLNCSKLKFVSHTSNWLEQMYDFQKHIMFHLM